MFRRIPKIKTPTYNLGEGKLKLKAVATTASIALLILAAFTLPTTFETADAQDERSSAYAVNMILEKALRNIQTLVEQERGTQAYEVLNRRLEGVRQMAEAAQRELKEGAYQQALSASMNALKSLTSITAELKDSADEEIVAAKHTTLRMNIFVNSIKNLTELASTKGYDVSTLKSRLKDVETLVKEAQNLSAKQDTLGSSQKIAESKKMLGHIISDLCRAYDKEKVKIVEDYVNKTLKRIYEVEEVRSRFTEQIKEFNSTKNQIQGGNFRSSLKRINEALENMEKKVREDLNNVKEEMVNLKKQINNLKAKGVNVEKQERLLQEAANMIEQASTYLEKGDYVAARMKIAQIESVLHRFR